MIGIHSRYITNVFAQGIGRTVTLLASVSVSILIAHISGAKTFGQYSFVIAFLGMALTIAEFGTTAVLARDITPASDTVALFYGNFLIFRLAMLLIVSLLTVFAGFALRPDLALPITIASVALPFLGTRFFEPIYQVNGRPWFSSISSIAYGVSYLALSIAAVSAGNGIVALIVAFSFANIIYTIVAFSLGQRVLKPRFLIRFGSLKNILAVSAPLGVSAILTSLNSRIAVFMLADMSSDRAVAMYSASYRFVEIAAMLAIMVFGPLLPILSHTARTDRALFKKICIQTIEVLGILAIPCAILLQAFSYSLLTMLYGLNFGGSAAVLDILAWDCITVFYSLLWTTIAISLGIVQFGYWNGFLACVLSLALNYYWIPQYGPVGSAWATLVVEIVLAGITFLIITRPIGCLFRAATCLKIIAGNIILCVIMNVPLLESGPIVKAILSLSAYTIFVIYFRLFPVEIMRAVVRMLTPLGNEAT